MPSDTPDIDAAAPPLLEEESKVMAKNQVTIPMAVARRLGIRPGDRIVWVMRPGDRGEVRMRRIRTDYTGALAGVYGAAEDAGEYVRQEQKAWND